MRIIRLSDPDLQLFWGYNRKTEAEYPPPCSMLGFAKITAKRFIVQPYVDDPYMVSRGYGRYVLKAAPRLLRVRRSGDLDEMLGLTGDINYNIVCRAFCESDIDADGFITGGAASFVLLKEPELFLRRVGGGRFSYTSKEMPIIRRMRAAGRAYRKRKIEQSV